MLLEYYHQRNLIYVTSDWGFMSEELLNFRAFPKINQLVTLMHYSISHYDLTVGGALANINCLIVLI